jgi:hypothetical protein
VGGRHRIVIRESRGVSRQSSSPRRTTTATTRDFRGGASQKSSSQHHTIRRHSLLARSSCRATARHVRRDDPSRRPPRGDADLVHGMDGRGVPPRRARRLLEDPGRRGSHLRQQRRGCPSRPRHALRDPPPSPRLTPPRPRVPARLLAQVVFKPPKAIRGGIPICFPQFSDFGPLGQHGFARNRSWEVRVLPSVPRPASARRGVSVSPPRPPTDAQSVKTVPLARRLFRRLPTQ